jgi:DNA repair protein RadC
MAAQRKQTADVIQLRLDEDAIIDNAIDILSRRLSSAGAAMGSPAAVKSFLTLKLAPEEREVFSVLWLDARNRLIAYEAMCFGTLTQTSVYPREVVKAALKHNAASVIVAHNHPSGRPCDPVQARQGGRLNEPRTAMRRYRASDELMAFLRGL